MIGGSTIPDTERGRCGGSPAPPGRALTIGALVLACGLAFGAGSVSGQMPGGGHDPARPAVTLLDEDRATLVTPGNVPGPLAPGAPLGALRSGWVSGSGSDSQATYAGHPPQAGILGRLCPACEGRLSGLFSPSTGPNRGLGEPLTCESWRFRPFSAGSFIGLMEGGTLIDDWVGGKHGFFAGYRLGWDFDHFWGCEMRFSFGTVALCDSQRAKDAQEAADDALGLAEDDPFRDRFERRRDATVGFWDIDLLYYPWGDAAWRPYLMLGLGTARTEFIDRLSNRYRETVFAMPLALGFKYRWSSCTAVRIELADNIAFGDRFDTVHYVSLTAGVEIRFGGRRVAYWPWNPGRHYW